MTTEGWHTADDGHRLYTKTWTPKGPISARLVFIHGFSDVLNAYNDFFPSLAARGFDVHAFDQRGWGRSVSNPSERGWTGPTTRVLDDMTSFLKTLIPSPVPLFLMGHSMGGGQVLCYAAQGPWEVRQHIRGYLLESPFVDFDPKSRPSSLTVFFGRLAGRLLPHRQMVNKLDVNLLSRDPAVCKNLDQDELCHNTGTLEGLSGMLDRTAALASGKIKIPDDAGEGGVTRILIAHGDADGITDFGASKRLAEAMEVRDKEFKAYAGFYHRMHDEPGADKEAFRDDVANWMLARVEPVQEPGAKARL